MNNVKYRIKGQYLRELATAGAAWGGQVGSLSPGLYAQSKWGDKFNWSALFAYCYRRFGLPVRGGDDLKEIASWYVDTPMKGVALWIKPHTSNYEAAHLSFGYGLAADVENSLYDDKRAAGTLTAITNALEAAIDDLERPVTIRDMEINCFGRVDTDEPLRRAVKPSFMAGYGVGLEFISQIKKLEREDED